MNSADIKHWCIDALGPLDRTTLLEAKVEFTDKLKTHPKRAEQYRHVLAFINRKLKHTPA
jgi:hypothetical protein